MHPRHEGVRALNGFPIDMKQHRLPRADRDLAHAGCVDAGLAVDAPGEEGGHADHVSEKSTVADHYEIEEPVRQIGSRSYLRATSPLPRVRERQHERCRLGGRAVDDERIFDGLIVTEISGTGLQIRQQPAMPDAGGHEGRDMRIESDACNVEEEMLTELPRIDHARF